MKEEDDKGKKKNSSLNKDVFQQARDHKHTWPNKCIRTPTQLTYIHARDQQNAFCINYD